MATETSKTGESLKVRLLALAALPPLLVSTVIVADGPGAYRPRERPRISTPAPAAPEQAADAYNAAYAAIQRADHRANLALAAVDDAERAAAHRDAQTQYAAAAELLERAIQHDRSLQQAYTYLGYTRRKLGRYDEALQAYEQALRLAPEDVYAIEYQGEAFLALDRLDEARFSYLRLYALDASQAAKLLNAMRTWIAARAQEPAGVSHEVLAEFKAWVDARPASPAPAAARSAW